jgi:MFS family permease
LSINTYSRTGQWRIILLLGLASIFALSADLTLYAVLPVSAVRLGLSLASIGVLLSANRIIRLFSNPAAGLVYDRWSRRSALRLGFGLSFISSILYIGMNGFWLFLAGRVLWGVAWSLINVGMMCAILDIMGEQERGWGMGVMQAFIFFGMAAGPLAGGLLNDRLGFTFAMTFSSGLSAIAFVAVMFLPETRASLPPRINLGSSSKPITWFTDKIKHKITYIASPELRNRLSLPRYKEFTTANYVYFLTHFMGDGILMSTISLYLQQTYGSGVTLAGIGFQAATLGGAAIGLRSVVSTFVAPLAGSFSDRRLSRWPTIAWSTAFGAAGLALIFASRSPFALLAGIFFVAINNGVILAVMPALVGDSSNERQKGASMGVLAMSADLGMSAAPLAAYALLPVIPLRSVYLLTAGLMLTGLVMIGLVISGRGYQGSRSEKSLRL